MLLRSKWMRWVLLLLPLALFFAAREKVSWRPQKIMDLPFDKGSFIFTDTKTSWMASTDNLRSWDVASGKLKWRLSQEGLDRDKSFLFATSAISKDCRYYFRRRAQDYSVWDIKKNKRILQTTLAEIESEMDFSADAQLLVSTNSGTPIYDSETGRLLWRSTHNRRITEGAESLILRSKHRFEVHEKRTGKFLRWLPVQENFVAIASEPADWLYTVNNRNELFRQRLC